MKWTRKPRDRENKSQTVVFFQPRQTFLRTQIAQENGAQMWVSEIEWIIYFMIFAKFKKYSAISDEYSGSSGS